MVDLFAEKLKADLLQGTSTDRRLLLKLFKELDLFPAIEAELEQDPPGEPVAEIFSRRIDALFAKFINESNDEDASEFDSDEEEDN